METLFPYHHISYSMSKEVVNHAAQLLINRFLPKNHTSIVKFEFDEAISEEIEYQS